MLTKEQVEVHRTALGGSDGAAILGYHPRKTPLQVYYDKVSALDGAPDDRDISLPMEVGNALEDLIVNRFATEAKVQCSPWNGHALVHPDYEHIKGFPDAIALDGKRRGIVEAKSTETWLKDEWEQGVPIQHQIQGHHYLGLYRLVYGESNLFLAVAGLIGKNSFAWQRFDQLPDSYYTDYFGALNEFWQNHICPRIPPMAMGERDLSTIKAIYAPDPNADILELAGADAERAEGLLGQWQACKSQANLMAKEAKNIETSIREIIKGAAGFALPSGGGVKVKVISKKGYSVQPSSYSQLEVF